MSCVVQVRPVPTWIASGGCCAGSTVCITLLGILVLGVGFLNGLAVASALTVVFTVLAAVTLLPALLGVFGIRVLSRRQRRRLAGAPAPGAAGAWARWAGTNAARTMAG